MKIQENNVRYRMIYVESSTGKMANTYIENSGFGFTSTRTYLENRDLPFEITNTKRWNCVELSSKVFSATNHSVNREHFFVKCKIIAYFTTRNRTTAIFN